MGPYAILLDCGLAEEALPVDPSGALGSADFVLCSHAHGDHGRGLRALRQAFPYLPIYGSEATSRLLPLNWPDGAVPTNLCQALPWLTPVAVRDHLTVQLLPAGHLPGAGCAVLRYTAPDRVYTVVYTGDFFLSNSRLVDGLSLEALRRLQPDVLIMEGSYGTQRHPHRRQQENQLTAALQRELGRGHSVLLPVPPLGLGQELVMLLRSHHTFTGQPVTVWVDGVVAAGCDRYLDLLPHLPASVQNFARHQALFWDERVFPQVRRLAHSPPAPAETDPGVGQVLIGHYSQPWANWARRMGPCTLFWPESTPPSLRPPGLEAIEAHPYQLASHCDGGGTTQLIHNLRPQHVMLVHGSATNLSDLAALEELQSRYQLHLPSPGNRVEFPLGETFLQPAAPEPWYEGEVTETGDAVLAVLPETLAADPRWQRLAETGLVQARWQGNELVLRGVSQRQLLQPRPDVGSSPETTRPACQHCRFLRHQGCHNPASPLHGFRVNPDGRCLEFEPLPNSAGLPEEDP